MILQKVSTVPSKLTRWLSKNKDPVALVAAIITVSAAIAYAIFLCPCHCTVPK